MNLQGRNLSNGMQGEDVKLLQEGLRQPGFAIEKLERTVRIRKNSAIC